VADEEGRECIRFTDFGSKLGRHLSGGLACLWLVYPPSFLPAVFMAGWRNVFGKSSCCKEKCKPIIVCDANKALH